MILTDVNVLVYAHRRDAAQHSAFRKWLEDLINGDQAFGFSELILSGFLRVATHPRIFNPPSRVNAALAFVENIRGQPNAAPLTPGPRHWGIFRGLCEATGVRGNLIPDAYLAALAIESGSQWITTDRDYSRFSGSDWCHPLDG